jgi:hypothetical protein
MFSIYKNWLQRKALLSTTQDISHAVANNEAAYRAETGIAKLAWRQVRREISFSFSGETKLLQTKINPGWTKGLWLYKGIPQIGDALMDLAPRNMLEEAGLSIDLLTDKHLAKMFENDTWFDRVFDEAALIDTSRYDFVIVPSHKRRSLKYKSHLFPQTPWVSIASFYTGPEYHRGEFASQRLADLLGRSLSKTE